MSDLLPCPFCGGKPTLKLGRGAWGVLCTCGGKTFIHTYDGGFVSTGKTTDEAKASAIAAWNRRALPATDARGEELTVWYGPMPESNGRQNWTAMLYRKGSKDRFLEGYCFDRSEYPDRVRYAADRMRWVIGELPERPDILAYDDKLHSGYVAPAAATDAREVALREAADLFQLHPWSWSAKEIRAKILALIGEART